MYWDEELTRLGAHKAGLLRSIERRRAECVEAAGRIALPFERLDRAVEIWRGLRPFISAGAAPLGLLIARLALPRRGILGSLVRWGPLAFAVARAFSSGVGREPLGAPSVRDASGHSRRSRRSRPSGATAP